MLKTLQYFAKLEFNFKLNHSAGERCFFKKPFRNDKFCSDALTILITNLLNEYSSSKYDFKRVGNH